MNIFSCIGKMKTDGTAPVYVRCYIEREKIQIHTGLSILPKYFDNKKEKIIGPQADDYNLIITKVKEKLSNIIIKYRLQDITPSCEMIQKELAVRAVDISFTEFAYKELALRSPILSSGTIKHNSAAIDKVDCYRPNTGLRDIDVDYLVGLKGYLLHSLEASTVERTMSVIRTYLIRAHDKGLIISNPFKRFKIRQIDFNKDYLLPTELKALQNFYITSPCKYRRVIRGFLLSCFTGLRYSDICVLSRDHIVGSYIVIVPQKSANTRKVVKIPLCQAALCLINENDDLLISPMISNQKTNVYLKEIARILSIPKLITFHTARHTFATIYLRNTRDARGLQKLLGHSDISTTMGYSHVMDEDIFHNINTFDNL